MRRAEPRKPARRGRQVPRLVPARVSAGYAPGPDLDIYLATKTMLALIASPVPAPLAAFAAGCTLASQRRRPADAWDLLREFDDVIERMWGRERSGRSRRCDQPLSD